MSPISRFSRPTQHIYQPTYEPLPFNQLANVGMQMQKEYNVEQDKRYDYYKEKASTSVGGGDVAIANQMIGQIEQDLKGITKQYPDYRAPESKAAFRDLVVQQQQDPRWGQMADTKVKYDASQADLASAPYAPDWAKQPALNQQAVYNQGGTDAVRQFNLQTLGIDSNEFINVKELSTAEKPTVYWEKRLGNFKQQMLAGGREGISLHEVANKAGLSVDPNGGLYFRDDQGIPGNFLDSQEGVRFRLESKKRFDDMLTNNPQVAALIATGQESYEGNLRNQMRQDYGQLVAPIVYQMAGEGLDPTAIAQQTTEDIPGGYVPNDFAQAIFTEDRYKFTPKVVAAALGIDYVKGQPDNQGFYNVSGDVKVQPANTDVAMLDAQEVVDIQDSLSSYNDEYLKIFGRTEGTDEEGNKITAKDGLLDDIAQATNRLAGLEGKYGEDIFTQKASLETRIAIDLKRATDKLRLIRDKVGSDVEIPDIVNDPNAFYELEEKIAEDYYVKEEQINKLTTQYGDTNVQNYRDKIEANAIVGQILKEQRFRAGIIIPTSEYNKENIDGIPHFKVSAVLSKEQLENVLNEARNRGANIPKKNKWFGDNAVEAIQRAGDFLLKTSDYEGKEVFNLDMYIPASDIGITEQRDANSQMRQGMKFNPAQTSVLDQEWTQFQKGEIEKVFNQ